MEPEKDFIWEVAQNKLDAEKAIKDKLKLSDFTLGTPEELYASKEYKDKYKDLTLEEFKAQVYNPAKSIYDQLKSIEEVTEVPEPRGFITSPVQRYYGLKQNNPEFYQRSFIVPTLDPLRRNFGYSNTPLTEEDLSTNIKEIAEGERVYNYKTKKFEDYTATEYYGTAPKFKSEEDQFLEDPFKEGDNAANKIAYFFKNLLYHTLTGSGAGYEALEGNIKFGKEMTNNNEQLVIARNADGTFKLNENNQVYTEKRDINYLPLDARDVYTMYDFGAFDNPILKDVFASDVNKRSFLGSIANPVVQAGGYFVPYVNATYLARDFTSLGNSMYETVTGKKGKVSAFLNSTKMGTSYLMKDDSFEYYANTLGSIVTSIGSMRGIAKSVYGVANLVKLGKPLTKTQSGIVGIASGLAIAGASSTTVRDEYLRAGATSKEAGIMHLTHTALMFGILNTPLGNWAIKNLKMSDTSNAAAKALRDTIAKSNLKNIVAKGVSPNMTWTKKVANTAANSYKKYLTELRSANPKLTAYAAAAVAEGIEEGPMEHTMQYGLKALYNSAAETGWAKPKLRKGQEKPFKLGDYWSELLVSTVLGGIGGVIGRGLIDFENRGQIGGDLIDIIHKGGENSIYEALNNMYNNGELGDFNVDYEGNAVRKADRKIKSVAARNYDLLKNSVDILVNIRDTTKGFMPSDQLKARYDVYMNADSGIHTTVLQTTTNLIQKIASNKQALKDNKIDEADLDLILEGKEITADHTAENAKLLKETAELTKKLETIYSGKARADFFEQAMSNILLGDLLNDLIKKEDTADDLEFIQQKSKLATEHFKDNVLEYLLKIIEAKDVNYTEEEILEILKTAKLPKKKVTEKAKRALLERAEKEIKDNIYYKNKIISTSYDEPGSLQDEVLRILGAPTSWASSVVDAINAILTGRDAESYISDLDQDAFDEEMPPTSEEKREKIKSIFKAVEESKQFKELKAFNDKAREKKVAFVKLRKDIKALEVTESLDSLDLYKFIESLKQTQLSLQEVEGDSEEVKQAKANDRLQYGITDSSIKGRLEEILKIFKLHAGSFQYVQTVNPETNLFIEKSYSNSERKGISPRYTPEEDIKDKKELGEANEELTKVYSELAGLLDWHRNLISQNEQRKEAFLNFSNVKDIYSKYKLLHAFSEDIEEITIESQLSTLDGLNEKSLILLATKTENLENLIKDLRILEHEFYTKWNKLSPDLQNKYTQQFVNSVDKKNINTVIFFNYFNTIIKGYSEEFYAKIHELEKENTDQPAPSPTFEQMSIIRHLYTFAKNSHSALKNKFNSSIKIEKGFSFLKRAIYVEGIGGSGKTSVVLSMFTRLFLDENSKSKVHVFAHKPEQSENLAKNLKNYLKEEHASKVEVNSTFENLITKLENDEITSDDVIIFDEATQIYLINTSKNKSINDLQKVLYKKFDSKGLKQPLIVLAGDNKQIGAVHKTTAGVIFDSINYKINYSLNLGIEKTQVLDTSLRSGQVQLVEPLKTIAHKINILQKAIASGEPLSKEDKEAISLLDLETEFSGQKGVRFVNMQEFNTLSKDSDLNKEDVKFITFNKNNTNPKYQYIDNIQGLEAEKIVVDLSNLPLEVRDGVLGNNPKFNMADELFFLQGLYTALSRAKGSNAYVLIGINTKRKLTSTEVSSVTDLIVVNPESISRNRIINIKATESLGLEQEPASKSEEPEKAEEEEVKLSTDLDEDDEVEDKEFEKFNEELTKVSNEIGENSELLASELKLYSFNITEEDLQNIDNITSETTSKNLTTEQKYHLLNLIKSYVLGDISLDKFLNSDLGDDTLVRSVLTASSDAMYDIENHIVKLKVTPFDSKKDNHSEVTRNRVNKDFHQLKEGASFSRLVITVLGKDITIASFPNKDGVYEAPDGSLTPYTFEAEYLSFLNYIDGLVHNPMSIVVNLKNLLTRALDNLNSKGGFYGKGKGRMFNRDSGDSISLADFKRKHPHVKLSVPYIVTKPLAAYPRVRVGSVIQLYTHNHEIADDMVSLMANGHFDEKTLKDRIGLIVYNYDPMPFDTWFEKYSDNLRAEKDESKLSGTFKLLAYESQNSDKTVLSNFETIFLELVQRSLEFEQDILGKAFYLDEGKFSLYRFISYMSQLKKAADKDPNSVSAKIFNIFRDIVMESPDFERTVNGEKVKGYIPISPILGTKSRNEAGLVPIDSAYLGEKGNWENEFYIKDLFISAIEMLLPYSDMQTEVETNVAIIEQIKSGELSKKDLKEALREQGIPENLFDEYFEDFSFDENTDKDSKSKPTKNEETEDKEGIDAKELSPLEKVNKKLDKANKIIGTTDKDLSDKTKLLFQAATIEKKYDLGTNAQNQLNKYLTENNLLVESSSLIGKKYDVTNTSVNASIAGESIENLIIIEVLEPIVFKKVPKTINGQNVTTNKIIGRGVVIVQNKQEWEALQENKLKAKLTKKAEIEYLEKVRKGELSIEEGKRLLIEMGKEGSDEYKELKELERINNEAEALRLEKIQEENKIAEQKAKESKKIENENWLKANFPSGIVIKKEEDFAIVEEVNSQGTVHHYVDLKSKEVITEVIKNTPNTANPIIEEDTELKINNLISFLDSLTKSTYLADPSTKEAFINIITKMNEVNPLYESSFDEFLSSLTDEQLDTLDTLEQTFKNPCNG